MMNNEPTFRGMFQQGGNYYQEEPPKRELGSFLDTFLNLAEEIYGEEPENVFKFGEATPGRIGGGEK